FQGDDRAKRLDRGSDVGAEGQRDRVHEVHRNLFALTTPGIAGLAFTPFAALAYNRPVRPEAGNRGTVMRRIAINKQKSGVGKTTTAVNLAAALADAGQRVCVLDLDPQAHATTHLGLEPNGKTASMYDVLVNSRPLAEVRHKVADNLWVCGSDINLAAAEVEL